MAEMNALIGNLAAAIASDDTIDVWSKKNYGHGVRVLENCDPRDEPESDDCPLVILYPVGKTGGLSQGVKVNVIGISCAVYNSEKPVSIEGVVMFSGGRLVEELRAYAFSAVEKSIPSDIHIESVTTAYNTIEQFPYVSANMELTLTQEKLIGSDPYE